MSDYPAVIGSYILQHQLGSGTIGTVFLAFDEEKNRQAAIKLMPLDDLPAMYDMSEEEYREMISQNFQNEADILGVLKHPGIPKLYGHGQHGGFLYTALQYIKGQTLLDVLDGQMEFLPPERVAGWGIQVCDALAHMHEQAVQLVYRDMKPSNLMVNGEDRVYLIDFGLAEYAGDDLELVGTIGYAPPEQYEGVSDPRTDVFALGATLHHLLTKRDPHHYEPFSFSEAPPSALNPAVPQALEDAVMKAVAYEPDDRFQSVRQMRKALKKVGF